MAYKEFSIESALMPTTQHRAVKLEGVGKVAGIFNSTNKSTEEFIQGAVSSLGNADCMVMYVHGSIEALEDRLQFAAKLAKPINTAKARGAEGFENVQTLNPWEYAIEGKVSDFFKRVWDAIKTACRRIIEAIAHFIKWLGNAIASLDVRSQVKDYETYTQNKTKINSAAKAAKIDDVKFKALPWKVDADGLAKIIKKAASEYAKAADSNGKAEDIKAIKEANGKLSSIDAETLAKKAGEIFGVTTLSPAETMKAIREKTIKLTADLNAQRESSISVIFGGKAEKTNAHKIVSGAVAKSETVGVITVGEMKKASKDFEVLDQKWLGNNVKEVISSVHKQQKEFTAYTKYVDSVAKALESAMVKADKNGGVNSIANELSKLANARILFNSFWTSMMLELESYALRFRKSAHIALKHYIRAAGKNTDTKKKGTESLSQESLEAMFDFQ